MKTAKKSVAIAMRPNTTTQGSYAWKAIFMAMKELPQMNMASTSPATGSQ
jgi:hypothetical protein